jgi:hypothetical protein
MTERERIAGAALCTGMTTWEVLYQSVCARLLRMEAVSDGHGVVGECVCRPRRAAQPLRCDLHIFCFNCTGGMVLGLMDMKFSIHDLEFRTHLSLAGEFTVHRLVSPSPRKAESLIAHAIDHRPAKKNDGVIN